MNKREQLKQRAINCLKSNNLEEIKNTCIEVNKEKENTEKKLDEVDDMTRQYDKYKESQINKKEKSKQILQKAKDFLKVTAIITVTAGTIYGISVGGKWKNNYPDEISNTSISAQSYKKEDDEKNIILEDTEGENDNVKVDESKDVDKNKGEEEEEEKSNKELIEKSPIDPNNQSDATVTYASQEGDKTVFSENDKSSQNNFENVSASATPQAKDKEKENRGNPKLDTTQKSTEVTNTQENTTNQNIQEGNEDAVAPKVQDEIATDSKVQEENNQSSIENDTESKQGTNEPSEPESDEFKDLLKKAKDQELEL